MGQVNSYPVLATLANGDTVLAWELSPARVVQIELSTLRDFLNSGAISTVDDTNLTVDRALMSNGSGKIAVATATAAQLNALAALTASRALVTDGSGVLTPSAVTAAQLGYLADLLDIYRGHNFIVNGDFRVAQKGTSFAAAANNTLTLDRWRYYKATTGAVHTVSQDTDVPTLAESDHKSSYSLLVDCTTADAALAAGDLVHVETVIEGPDFANLQGKTCTLQFWVKATKTGVYCVSLGQQLALAGRRYVAEFTVNAADTWEEKSITLNFSDAASGGWLYTPGSVGLTLSFVLMAGSTYQVAAGAWGASGGATSNQVNAADNTANNFRLSQVELKIGDADMVNFSKFQQRPYQQELALCQRFFFRLGGDASANGPLLYGYAGVTTANLAYWIPFPVEMAASPTATVNGTWGLTNCTGPTVPNKNTKGFVFHVAPQDEGDVSCYTNGADDYIDFDTAL